MSARPVRVTRISAAVARRQAPWIAAMEPWRSLGYDAGGLGRWLARMGRAGNVLAAHDHSGVRGLIVTQQNLLLGDFIALLAVRPEAAAEGIGRALVARVEARTFRRRRWLYVSSDRANTTAAGFYRRLGFARVGRLPDLIRRGRTEILWRKGR